MKQAIKNILRKIITSDRFFSIVNNFTPIAVNGDGIKFYGLFQIPYDRGKTLLSKEPDMIAFINDYVQYDDVYYDVGANVGVFSMYSAIKRGAKVFSFEPESSNYFILNKNISLNNMSSRITAYNIALNNTDEVSVLNLKENIIPGKSGNTFKEELNENHEKFCPQFKQGVFGMPLDDFIYKYGQPCPNHLKIDVDGNEYKIISGMKKTLNDINLKTIAIEVNTKTQRDNELIKIIENSGFIKVNGYVNYKYEENGIVNYFYKR